MEWLADDKRPLDWNGPVDRPFVSLSDADLERPILDLVADAVRRSPDRIAIADADSSLTYAELWLGAAALAETIRERSSPGDLIGVLPPTSALSPLAMLACLGAGRPFVALDPHYPNAWLNQALSAARPALIIGRDIELKHIPKSARGDWRPAPLSSDEPACVLFSSGSTGRPKGIVNGQRGLLQRAIQSIGAAHINADDSLLTLASPCTIVGVRDILTALIAGARIRPVDMQRTGAREIRRIIAAEGVTILFAFPALMRAIVSASATPAGDALRLARMGGDTTLWSDIDLLRGWLPRHASIQIVYAATEAPMMQWFVDGSLQRDDPRVPIGYPLRGNRLAILDEHGSAAAPGDIGELVVRSPYVSLGRWADGRFAPTPADADGARTFRTGDLVRQRSDGLLERIGRTDRQVKVRGTRVDLDAVEAALRRHPFVRDAGALLSADATLIAYVSAREGAPNTLIDDLRAATLSAPPHERPARIERLDDIPRLPSSKLDVQALAALDDARRNAPAPKPEDPIVRAVSQAWREILGASPTDPEDDFFEAGGDSLKAMAFMVALERALGVELPVTLINEAPSFAALCGALRGTGVASARLVLLKAGDDAPPVFIVHGIGGNVVELIALARRMTWPGPVIAIQARGLAGKEKPHPSVEAMAADYLDEIRARQPAGPYHICGYSFGGLVAFEIARRMEQAGDAVGLVGLFDTMMSPVRWPLRAWASMALRRLASAPKAVQALWRRLQKKEVEAPPRTLAQPAPAGILKVRASALIASARYRPGYFGGELTLFSPAGREPGLPSLESIWSAHAKSLAIVEVPGVHATMLAPPNADLTAAALTRCLDAQAPERRRPASV